MDLEIIALNKLDDIQKGNYSPMWNLDFFFSYKNRKEGLLEKITGAIERGGRRR